MYGANIRFGPSGDIQRTNASDSRLICHPGGESEANVVFTIGGLGMGANVLLMIIILMKRSLRRWSLGLVFHQGLVDCARASLLIPLGFSIRDCQPFSQCGLLETSFLLLVTVSTINMLTTVLNDLPVFLSEELDAPGDDDDDDEEENGRRNNAHALVERSPGGSKPPFKLMVDLVDSPQCVFFGMFMIWFASITINLGPTFLSGGLASNSEASNMAFCPLISGPFRHYVLNVLWILINVLCLLLTAFHLHKLYREVTQSGSQAVRVAGLVATVISVDGTDERDRSHHRRVRSHVQGMERDTIHRVKMFGVITVAYFVFWGPLFVATLLERQFSADASFPSSTHGITLHIAFVHAIVNPLLFLALHAGLRHAIADAVCCACCAHDPGAIRNTPPRAPGYHFRPSSLATSEDILNVPPLPPELEARSLRQHKQLQRSTLSIETEL